MDRRIEAMKALLRMSGRPETGPTLHRAKTNPAERIQVGPTISRAHAASIAPDGELYTARIGSKQVVGSADEVIKALSSAGLGVGGLSALGAASLPREASAMDDLPSPREAMANPRAAAEHPEERAARVAAERVDEPRYDPSLAQALLAEHEASKPSSLWDLIERDKGMQDAASNVKGAALFAGPFISDGAAYAGLMASPAAPMVPAMAAAGLAGMGMHGYNWLRDRTPGPVEQSLLDTLDMAGSPTLVAEKLLHAVSHPPEPTTLKSLVAGGYQAPHMASGGRVGDALAKLFKKGATVADEPDLARRGFLGLNRAEAAPTPEAETFSGLVTGGAASELASKLNPEMSRRGFMGNTGVAAVSTVFPLNSQLVRGLSTLVEPAAPVNHNAAWTKAMTDWIKDPDLVEDAVGYLGQGGRLSNFMENGTVSKAPAYIKETMGFIAKQPKAIQGDVAKAIDSYFDSMNTLNNAEYSSGLSLESLVDRHPANAALRQQILDEMAPTRQALLDKLPASWDRQVMQSPDYAALKAHDAQVAARISEAGELPGSYADLLEPGQHYRQSEWANLIDQHGEPVYYPGSQQDPLTASQWFDKHRNIALGERAQRQAPAPEEYQPFEMQYNNVSGADRFARGGLVHLAEGGLPEDTAPTADAAPAMPFNYIETDPFHAMPGYTPTGQVQGGSDYMMSGQPDNGGWDPETAKLMYFPRSYFNQGAAQTAPTPPLPTTPTAPSATPAWDAAVMADQTYYPAGALNQTSPAGYFTATHQWQNGSAAPGGYSTWSPPAQPAEYVLPDNSQNYGGW